MPDCIIWAIINACSSLISHTRLDLGTDYQLEAVFAYLVSRDTQCLY